jgi:hypothetical protein
MDRAAELQFLSAKVSGELCLPSEGMTPSKIPKKKSYHFQVILSLNPTTGALKYSTKNGKSKPS